MRISESSWFLWLHIPFKPAAEKSQLLLISGPTLSLSSRLSSNGLMNKVAMMVMTEVLHRLSNTDFHSLRLTKQWPLLSPQSASSENNTESALPRMICHLSDGRLITLNHFQQFLLTKRDSYSIQMSFLHAMLLPKLPPPMH